MDNMELNWVEISKSALIHNLKTFRGLVGKNVLLALTIKANAYGHGLIECAEILEENGADFLCVNAFFEAEKLRKAGIKTPILIIGYTPLSDLDKVTTLKDVELIVYNLETVNRLGKIGKKIGIHLKIETGNHRQGIEISAMDDFINALKKYPNIQIRGISTHFANLEDRINQKYALYQLKEFKRAIHKLETNGFTPHYKHCSNTAATILMPESYFNFVRVGIGIYGLWSSEKTRQSAERCNINIELKPVLAWKTVVAQIKDVKKGAMIGYGCTYEMPYDGKIVILPIGYYDGFVKLLSNKGFVLIHGKKCPIVGRVCMNMVMVNVTDIPNIALEDEVVLIGEQKGNKITAEEVAVLSDTINYEVTTRINERIPRILK